MNIHTQVRVDADGIMIVEVNDEGAVVGNLYDLTAEQVDTEQKVLAWVYQLSKKAWMDRASLCEFIRGCETLHPDLDIGTR